LVSHTEVGTSVGDVPEWGAVGDVWAEEGGINRRIEKIT